jgi:hypothetical protein
MKLRPDQISDDTGQVRLCREILIIAETAEEGLILQNLYRAFLEGARITVEYPAGESAVIRPPGRISGMN